MALELLGRLVIAAAVIVVVLRMSPPMPRKG
jgi:hypothetical protein